MRSDFTRGKRCQCVFPYDCGQGGCATTCSPTVSVTDIETEGLLSHTRTLTSELVSTCCSRCEPINFDFGNGYNWLVSAWPYITDCQGPPLYVVLPAQSPFRFCIVDDDGCPGGGSGYRYSPGCCQAECASISSSTDPSGDALTYRLQYVEADDSFAFTDGQDIWRFLGFRPDRVEKGRFKSYESGGRKAEAAGYTGFGHITRINFLDTTGSLSSFVEYAYTTFAEAAGQVAERLVTATYSVVSSGQTVPVRRVNYTYYTRSDAASSSSSSSSSSSPGDEFGTLGDLKTATTEVYSGGQWVSLGTQYMRYYTDTDRVHRLKYLVEAEGYARMVEDELVSDPLTATEEQVAEYASHFFDYDAQGLVSTHRLLGGSQTTISYQDGSTTSSDFNEYHREVVETRSDGRVDTRYTNFQNQPLLEETVASAAMLEYREYNSDGHMTLHATPSALAGYSRDGYEITPTYKSEGGQYTVGLVHLYEYYSQTTTGTGGGAVKGFLQHEKLRQGRDGTPVLVRSYEYTERSILLSLESGSSSSSSSSGGDETLRVTIYPIAKETHYRNEDGTGAIETSYSYSWYPGSLQMQERVTTLPVIAAAHNGSGVSATRTERFDMAGNLVWLKDERGFITYHAYDALGHLTRTVQDVDGSRLALPSGWSTPAGGGLHLVTDYSYDEQGRQTQVLGPEHNVDGLTVRTASWTVHKDAERETRSAQGYYVPSTQSYTLVNPVSLQKRNATGTRSESIQATRASTSGKLLASDTFALSSYVRWTVSLFNNSGQQTATRVYHTIPASGDGSAGTNYDETTYGYDSMGRQNMVTSPGGTISRTVFDKRGRSVCAYVGTDDSGASDADPSAGREPCSYGGGSSGSSGSSSSSASGSANNNMVLVSEQEYHDDDCTGCSGGGGHLASTTQHVDANTFRTTEFHYDWRGRQEYVIPPTDDQGRIVYTRYHYNNLDQVTKVERYQEQYPSADVLLARQESFFDDLGRTYETRRYAVNPTNGSVGDYLAGYTWYDAAGNAIKQQGEGPRSFTKTVFDGLGRAVKQFVGYDLDESTYAEADHVNGDTILEQTETNFDEAGHVLVVTSRQRRHDATGTGELTTMSGSQPQARVSYVAYWFDEIGRQTAVANYGTNGDSALTRPSTVPARSDTVLVTTTEFDSAGQAYKTVDPAGREDRQEFDDAGRVVKSIQNYQDGVVNAAYPDEDVTWETAYTADGQIATLTAKNPVTGDQVTTYVYGTTLADSDIARKDLLRAEIYPESDDVAHPLGNGVDGVYDRIEYRYNRQAERTEKKDQNGTVHAFVLDNLGRLLHDRVTTLGTDIDGAVRCTSTTYEVRGMREKVTNYDNATVGSGNAVNEVVYEHNDLGMLTKEYQEHEGAKDGNTLYVQYNFDTTASGSKFTKGLRPSSIRYPNGRLVHFTYGSADSTADVLNRLEAIKDDSGGSPGSTLASYSYLGLGTIVIEDYEQPDVRLECFFDSSYAGFDRFGRVVDQRWYDYGASADRDRYTYGYDRASNRTYRENTIASAKDEFYTYDAINRLATFDRGDLNVGKTAISGTPVREEDWSLDMTGNWKDYLQKTSGSTDLDQDRTHNKVNEISDITETAGTAWATPVHDRAGNMTSIPKPASLASSLSLKWDAWNRLVEAKDGATVIGVYEYDPLNRRVKRNVDSQSPANPNGIDTYIHYFYNSAWQVLETRDTTTESDQPESLQPDWQYVWSPRYIDAPVLRDKNTDADGLCDDERFYYLGDANFNVTTLVDTGGDAVERYLYEPYGKETIYDGAWSSTRSVSSYGNVVRFTGRDIENESAFFCHRHRRYQPVLGRFIARDPIAFTANGVNLYWYANNGSPNITDPMGLYPGLEGHGDAISPEESVSKVSTIQSAADTEFDAILNIVPPVTLKKWSSAYRNGYRLMAYFRAIGTDRGNRFVYTCRYGWIDHGHFFNNAAFAYLANRYFAWKASDYVEVAQWIGRSNSAWSPEDLISNQLGRDLGRKAYWHDLKAVVLHPFTHPFGRIPRQYFYHIAHHWLLLLKGAGTVKWTSRTTPVLDQDQRDFAKNPRNDIVTVQMSRSYYESTAAYKCLCRGERPKLAEDEY